MENSQNTDMPSKVKYEIMAANGTYTKDGEEKKRWQRCGTCFENEKGQLSLKIDAMPVGSEWSGWFSLFEPKEQGRDREPRNSYVPGSRGAAQYGQRESGGSGPDDVDDVPFAPFNPPLGL